MENTGDAVMFAAYVIQVFGVIVGTLFVGGIGLMAVITLVKAIAAGVTGIARALHISEKHNHQIKHA